MPKKDTTVEITTTQKVNNPDGTQTEITVKERRLKKAHDKQMAKLQSRQRRHAAEMEQNSSDKASAQDEAEELKEPESQAPTEPAKPSGRRKKSEQPAPAPETESPAVDSGSTDSESGETAAE